MTGQICKPRVFLLKSLGSQDTRYWRHCLRSTEQISEGPAGHSRGTPSSQFLRVTSELCWCLRPAGVQSPCSGSWTVMVPEMIELVSMLIKCVFTVKSSQSNMCSQWKACPVEACFSFKGPLFTKSLQMEQHMHFLQQDYDLDHQHLTPVWLMCHLSSLSCPGSGLELWIALSHECANNLRSTEINMDMPVSWEHYPTSTSLL